MKHSAWCPSPVLSVWQFSNMPDYRNKIHIFIYVSDTELCGLNFFMRMSSWNSLGINSKLRNLSNC